MYDRKSSENGLIRSNLNSIASSLSSLETIGRNGNQNRPKSHTNSTSLLWPKTNGFKNNNNGTYATATRRTNQPNRNLGSDIYYSGGKDITSFCSLETALNFMLVPILLLTITRQVFDFLGQIWLQILINFFTIILLIVALFGIRQHRISYISIYLIWSLFNTVWNIFVIRIYSKVRDIGVNEDFLSLYTGATSWWNNNGPGCINQIQPTISMIQPTILAGCRLDYHTIESSQALVHALLSFISCLSCGCLILKICRNPKIQYKQDQLYRLNTLTGSRRSKVNRNPAVSSRHNSNSASLRRALNKDTTRSSQHSLSSQRSAVRRRGRQPSESALPTPRGSTSSTIQRSQKYGSLSSRRSGKKERRDASSLTYGTTVSGSERTGPSTRTRLSSVSSSEYLPSYAPKTASNANLIDSSIDSYVRSHNGNTNLTYASSRGSIYSQSKTNVNNNYHDLSYIYGNNNSDRSSRTYQNGHFRQDRHQQQQHQRPASGQEMRAESHQYDNNGLTNAKLLMTNTNAPLSSFPRSNNLLNGDVIPQMNGDQQEINNNYINAETIKKSQASQAQQVYSNRIYSNETGETLM